MFILPANPSLLHLCYGIYEKRVLFLDCVRVWFAVPLEHSNLNPPFDAVGSDTENTILTAIPNTRRLWACGNQPL